MYIEVCMKFTHCKAIGECISEMRKELGMKELMLCHFQECN